MKKKEAHLLAFTTLFLGIVLGFILSPVKKGLCIASNNYINRPDGRFGPKRRWAKKGQKEQGKTEC